ncbi:hypothetical protein GCM10010510_50000 [Streptomyces anandii JCM 4720]|nr:hypothetical protein GCM10010510_50000 [Streptomyces anandii JCM 4720]
MFFGPMWTAVTASGGPAGRFRERFASKEREEPAGLRTEHEVRAPGAARRTDHAKTPLPTRRTVASVPWCQERSCRISCPGCRRDTGHDR